MRRLGVIRIVAIALLVSVAGCLAPEDQVFQENFKVGATLDDMARTKLACERTAAQEVPAAFVQSVQVSPIRTSCSAGSGPTQYSPEGYRLGGISTPPKCTSTGGAAQTTVSDANKALRDRVYYQCLTDRGFRNYSARGCSPQEISLFNSRHPDPETISRIRFSGNLSGACFLTSNFYGGALFLINPAK